MKLNGSLEPGLCIQLRNRYLSFRVQEKDSK
jgi:hypothetical protein